MLLKPFNAMDIFFTSSMKLLLLQVFLTQVLSQKSAKLFSTWHRLKDFENNAMSKVMCK